MAPVQQKPMTWEEYLAWEARQELRYEFIDGAVYAMNGGTLAHGAIGANIREELSRQLKGGPCRRDGPTTKVQTGTGNGRYPDALVDCGPFVPDAMQAQQPTIVFEVLSQSTTWKDQNTKFADYDATPTIQHYAIVFQDEICVMVYSRPAGGHFERPPTQQLRSRSDVWHVPGFGIALPLSAVYDGLNFDEPGRAVARAATP